MIIYKSKSSFNFIDKYDQYFGFTSQSYSEMGDEIHYKVFIKEKNKENTKILFSSEEDDEQIFNDYFLNFEDMIEKEMNYCECTTYYCEEKCKTYNEYVNAYKNDLFQEDFKDFYISKIDENFESYFEISDGEKTFEITIETSDYCQFYNDYKFKIKSN